MVEEYNNKQEDNTQAGTGRKRHVFLTKKKMVLSIVAILILFEIWDIFIDSPAWWRFQRQQDKNAILNYAEKTYPDGLKRKGGEFPLQLPAGPFEPSIMYFELDGINFSISALDGIITDDTYYKVKAEKYIRENFIDGFMNDRGLTPDIQISFVSPLGHFGTLGKDVLDNVYNFEGSIHITIKQSHIGGVSNPREVGWFYDFYQFWIENCDLPNCVIYLHYRQNNDYSTDESDYVVWFMRGKKTFSNEDEFYNEFTT